MKTILGFYKLSQGEILIKSENMFNFNEHSLRQKIRMIPQENYIFKDSLYFNLTLDHTPKDEDKLLSLITLVGLKKLLNKIPVGFDTIFR